MEKYLFCSCILFDVKSLLDQMSWNNHSLCNLGTENKYQIMTNSIGTGWRPLEEYFTLYQKRIKMENNLFKYVQPDHNIYSSFFLMKEFLSTDEIMLVIELFNRLIIQDFVKKIGESCLLKDDVLLSEKKWALSLQQLDKEDFLSLVACLVLAKKFHDRCFTISNPIVKGILLNSGKEVTAQDLVHRELKVLVTLNHNVNYPVLSTYCNTLYELIHADNFGITRQAFYEISPQLYRIYFANIDSINSHLDKSLGPTIEIIGAGILCTLFHQLATEDEKCAPSHFYKLLEVVTGLRRSIIIKTAMEFIEVAPVI